MSNKHLSGKPHKLKKQPAAWWYEEIDGIAVIVMPFQRTTSQIKIPWRSIRAALKRKDRK